MKKNLLSSTEVAKLLGISRIAVFKKIKSGQIKAKKIGRNYVIDRKDLPLTADSFLSAATKKIIEEAVSKTVREYGETLRMLGKE
jgi:excisionase family DNA binding protein